MPLSFRKPPDKTRPFFRRALNAHSQRKDSQPVHGGIGYLLQKQNDCKFKHARCEGGEFSNFTFPDKQLIKNFLLYIRQLRSYFADR